jgi:hypothetical protein
MPRGASAARRTEINRAKIDEALLRVADGLFNVGKHIVRQAVVPMAEPSRTQLYARGGAIGWVNGKRIAAWAREGSGTQPKKPRAVKVSGTTIVVVGGFGFPARFQEIGTINQPSRPFLTPVFMRAKELAGGMVRASVGASAGPVASGGGEE